MWFCNEPRFHSALGGIGGLCPMHLPICLGNTCRMRIGNSTRFGKRCPSRLRSPIDMRQTGLRRIGRRCVPVTRAGPRFVSHLHPGRLHRCGSAADPTVAAFPAIALFCNLPAAAFSATASFCQAGSGRSIRHALDSRSCHGRLTATELAANLAWEAVPDSIGEHRRERHALPKANGRFDMSLLALSNMDRPCRRFRMSTSQDVSSFVSDLQ